MVAKDNKALFDTLCALSCQIVLLESSFLSAHVLLLDHKFDDFPIISSLLSTNVLFSSSILWKSSKGMIINSIKIYYVLKSRSVCLIRSLSNSMLVRLIFQLGNSG
uniref:Uncharacterized protein n=1 Tax=Manihot esculenta TaxID=3983 RepID=A0A2C9W401_MANES